MRTHLMPFKGAFCIERRKLLSYGFSCFDLRGLRGLRLRLLFLFVRAFCLGVFVGNRLLEERLFLF